MSDESKDDPLYGESYEFRAQVLAALSVREAGGTIEEAKAAAYKIWDNPYSAAKAACVTGYPDESVLSPTNRYWLDKWCTVRVIGPCGPRYDHRLTRIARHYSKGKQS